MFKLAVIALAMVVCCVNADEPLGEDNEQRHGGQFPSAQILGGGSRYPPNTYNQAGYPSNSYGPSGYPPAGTGHLPLQNNGQWGNYHGNHNSYGSHGGHGSHGSHGGHGSYGGYNDYGNHGNYGNHGGNGHGQGHGHGHGRH